MSRAQPPRQSAPARRASRLWAWAARFRVWRSGFGRLGAGRAALAAAAARLYRDLVRQARSEGFYRALGVPDTPEGRFEMIGLHAALILLRLRAEGAAGQALGQALFDLMVADLDQSLRELGVGDLGVGKQAKRLAGQFYARLRALDDILGGKAPRRGGGDGAGASGKAGRAAGAGGGGEAGRAAGAGAAGRLGAVLRANVWHGGRAPDPAQVGALADYLIRSARALRDQSADRLLAGEATFAAAAGLLPGERRPGPDR